MSDVAIQSNNSSKFYRLCKHVNDFGILIPAEVANNPIELQKILDKDPNADWYISLYTYNQDALEYYNKTERRDANGTVVGYGSVAGYTGKVSTNKLVFDFDIKKHTSATLQDIKADVITLLKKLKSEGVKVAQHTIVYFSGNKGFHVEVETTSEFSPEELKIICSNFAHGIKTFDTTIYNVNRIFRLVNTKHKVSGLFKIALNPNDLVKLSIEEIKSLAQKPIPTIVVTPLQDLAFINKYRGVIKPKSIIVSVDETEGIRGLNTIDFKKMPRHMPRCIYALSKGIMVPGERSRVFFRLAAYYRNQGMEKELAHRVLKGIAELNARLYPEADAIDKDEIWMQHIASAYSAHAKPKAGGPGTTEDNELLHKYCAAIKNGPPCILHNKISTESALVQIEEVSDSFGSFAENYDSNRVFTGIDFIDGNVDLTIGTKTLLIAATGVGKTSLALNIMEKANELGQRTVFFSMDMYKNLVYQKIAQKCTNYTKSEIMTFYKGKNTQKIAEIRQAVAKTFNKTTFDFSSTLTMDQMKERVKAVEQKTGEKVKLVVVDYAGRITSDKTDAHANAKYNALKAPEVAADTEAAWIYLCQISRNTGDGSVPLRTKRAAKEAGDWEEMADAVITMWRPFMGYPDLDDVARLYIAKNRLGPEVEGILKWNGAKSDVSDMTFEEQQEYKINREEQEKEILKSKYSR